MSGLNDLDHYIGADLAWTDTADLATVNGATRGKQRILRRLLTNPGDYIANPTYGAGLPQKIGSPGQVQEIVGLIRGQIFLEQAVARSPDPQITVTPLQVPQGSYSITIKYTDSETGSVVTLAFDPSNPTGAAQQ